MSRSYDADLVGHVEGVVVLGQAHVSLLLAVGADEGVHLLHGDAPALGHGLLDLGLVGAHVAEEDEGVVGM